MYKKYVKRLLDILLALITLPFFIIIFIIIAPFIYFEDRGPIFYNADRLGKNGKIFKMYKFRSMKVNAPDIRNKDGSTFNSENDYRLTKVGKFIRKTSIDEIPQILNVLKGDMSFVGPRPLLENKKTRYSEEINFILLIKPGITGYSQAYYRNSINQKEKFKKDMYYVDNISFLLDLEILKITLFSIFNFKNIYNKS